MMQTKPIDIAYPKREHCHTPLSARGDLLGAYFPNHEKKLRQYKTHPFSTSPELDCLESWSSTPNSPTARPTRSTSRPIVSPTNSNPDTMNLHVGIYHPSNYKPIPIAVAPPPTNQSSSSSTHLDMSFARKAPALERRSSDINRSLQLCQRDRITQARLANPSGASAHGELARIAKLSSPSVQPLHSPGWITPFEMEETTKCMWAGRSVPEMGAEEMLSSSRGLLAEKRT